MSSQRFSKEAGAVLIVDVQERLAAAMDPKRMERLLNRTIAAIEGAKALGLPIAVTEQYPKGLGPTMKALSERIPGFAPIEKLEFSAWLPQVKERFTGRPNVLVLGMETHVCVFQTVRAIADAGFAPHLATDAVASRTDEDREIGLSLCKDAGARLTTVEAVLFDALGKAGGPEFKAVSAAVK
jgi:nicotinamidase-related amidase